MSSVQRFSCVLLDAAVQPPPPASRLLAPAERRQGNVRGFFFLFGVFCSGATSCSMLVAPRLFSPPSVPPLSFFFLSLSPSVLMSWSQTYVRAGAVFLSAVTSQFLCFPEWKKQPAAALHHVYNYSRLSCLSRPSSICTGSLVWSVFHKLYNLHWVYNTAGTDF